MDSFTSEQIQETKNQEFEFLNSIDPIKPIQVRKIPSSFPQYNWPSYIKKDPFLWNCTKRVHYENKNNLIVWVGETGIGKSETASSAADAMDITPLGGEQFTRNFIIKDDGKGNPVPECRAFFRGADLLRHVRSGLPKGSHLLWDEAGIDNDNTKWYEKKSKLVKYILQTFRFKNLTLHMTVPDIESITLGTRRLVHCVIDVQERNTQAARCKIAWLHRVRRLKKTIVYPKMPAYVDKETGKDTLVRKSVV